MEKRGPFSRAPFLCSFARRQRLLGANGPSITLRAERLSRARRRVSVVRGGTLCPSSTPMLIPTPSNHNHLLHTTGGTLIDRIDRLTRITRTPPEEPIIGPCGGESTNPHTHTRHTTRYNAIPASWRTTTAACPSFSSWWLPPSSHWRRPPPPQTPPPARASKTSPSSSPSPVEGVRPSMRPACRPSSSGGCPRTRRCLRHGPRWWSRTCAMSRRSPSVTGPPARPRSRSGLCGVYGWGCMFCTYVG